MHRTADDLIASLRGVGLRATAPRRAVCAVIADRHDDHLTAADIVGELDGAADQATVYRTLDALEQAGVLTHTHLGHGPSVYHLAEGAPHHHVVCSECGATVEIPMRDLASTISAIRERTGYQLEPGHFALAGRCPDCASR